MPAMDSVFRLAPYAREALENREVRGQIRGGTKRLRSAYLRGRKRRIKAARDERVRRQAREGAIAFVLAARAIARGARRPNRRPWRWRIVLVLGLGAAGVALAFVLKSRSEGGPQ
jgi:hypothetical protein